MNNTNGNIVINNINTSIIENINNDNLILPIFNSP